jgi:glucoamylase
VHVAKLPTKSLRPSDSLQFTFFWLDTNGWEGRDYGVAIEGELVPA